MRRAVFFNLTQIQMPVGAATSIIHRITGILLAISLSDVFHRGLAGQTNRRTRPCISQCTSQPNVASPYAQNL
jgi:succinate dehydrogenase/fumarate reductase cytochrome b subunit